MCTRVIIVDVDECLLSHDNCNQNATCNNTDGSYVKLVIHEAVYSFLLMVIAKNTFRTSLQVPYLERSFKQQPTDQGSTIWGFAVNFNNHADIDECESGDHNCDMNAICTNTVGNYLCHCQSSFFGDGFTCKDQLPFFHSSITISFRLSQVKEHLALESPGTVVLN